MEQIMISNKQHHHKNDNNILRRMHRDSQTILSKNKPQVRIIHIFAPEIIKTDPANFRELVQRLTGKPSVSREKLTKKRPKSGGRRVVAEEDNIRSKVETVKSEEAAEIWRSSSSSGGSGDYNESGGFLAGFTDMEDGFMQQLGLFQPSLDLLLPQNHNPALMHHHQHPYRYNQNQQQQQQQQHHFFGEEDHTHNYRVI
ncbi:hypothetical protein QQ045_023412 [Rhodiola kirilowii]